MVGLPRRANVFDPDSRSLVWSQDGLCGSRSAAEDHEVMFTGCGIDQWSLYLHAAIKSYLRGRLRPLCIGPGGNASRPVRDKVSGDPSYGFCLVGCARACDRQGQRRPLGAGKTKRFSFRMGLYAVLVMTDTGMVRGPLCH